MHTGQRSTMSARNPTPTNSDAAAVIELLDDIDRDHWPDDRWGFTGPEVAMSDVIGSLTTALRRIAEQHAPGDEPRIEGTDPDWQSWHAAHAEWRKGTAIMADIRAALEGTK